MPILLDICYFIALVIAFPFLLIKSKRTGKYRTDWGARFGRHARSAAKAEGTRRLMIHCVSVGELLSVKNLAEGLLRAEPTLQLLITTTTDTGTSRARELFPAAGEAGHVGRILTARYPLDFSFAVKRFLQHFEPDGVVLIELETWPNFLTMAKRRGIPVYIVNGRLTERALSRYMWARPVVASMLRKLTWLGVQTETIAERFKKLGAPAERITIVPTLKYDSAQLTTDIPGKGALAAACGIRGEHVVFTGGSTGPGEEKAIIEAYLALRGEFPALRLAIAPRKPETVGQVVEAIARAGLMPVQRTRHLDGAGARGDLLANEVLVLDTLGELRKLYALSAAVFVGRSLVPLGGSDMIEVAAMGKALCFGPHTANFAEAAELLLRERAAVEVKDGLSMGAAVHAWLKNPEEAAALGRRARELIAAQQGSTQKYVEKIVGMLRVAEN